MQSSLVKGIIACVVLVILCFMVGSLVTESFVAASVVVAVLVGLVFILLSGTQCWVLIFLAAPLLRLLPLPVQLHTLPSQYMISVVIFIYWMLMVGMGYVKVQWRVLWPLDLLILIQTVYFISLYIRRPVSIWALGLDLDDIGGAEYVYALLATIYYITLSIIPMQKERLCAVLNWSMVVTVVSLFVASIISVARDGVAQVLDSYETDRVGQFFEFGRMSIIAIYAAFPIGSIIVNPAILFGAITALFATMISGSRANIAYVAGTIITMSIVKREFIHLCIVGGGAYFTFLIVGMGGGLEKLPLPVQRLLTMAPGIEVSAAAKRSAQGTWDWRQDLWALAWDKRTGYIKNYMFGDGFGQSESAMQRRARALMRGEYVYGQDLDEFATKGVWHNGIITIIHRMGYVGLVIVSLIFIVGSCYMFRACISLRGTPFFVACVYYTTYFFAFIPFMMWGHPDVRRYLATISGLAMIKLMYCIAREEERIKPLFKSVRYVPQMIQEHGERIRPLQLP